MEIERKWILSDVPTVPHESVYADEQIYLSVTPEVRLRKCELVSGVDRGISPYLLTIKSDGGLVQEEHQVEIPRSMYEGGLALVDDEPITKEWKSFNVNGAEIEVSIVDEGVFIYAEVEFDSVEEAQKYVFPWPELVIKETTGDSRYSMKNYWVKGSIPFD